MTKLTTKLWLVKSEIAPWRLLTSSSPSSLSLWQWIVPRLLSCLFNRKAAAYPTTLLMGSCVEAAGLFIKYARELTITIWNRFRPLHHVFPPTLQESVCQSCEYAPVRFTSSWVLKSQARVGTPTSCALWYLVKRQKALYTLASYFAWTFKLFPCRLSHNSCFSLITLSSLLGAKLSWCASAVDKYGFTRFGREHHSVVLDPYRQKACW